MPRSPYLSHPDDVETLVFPWGRFNVTCSPALNGTAALSAGVTTMHPGLGHERHNHPGAEEILFVISGAGEQMIEDEQGEPLLFAIRPGSTIHVPADRYHATLNTGAEPLSVFVVYSPPGAEQAPRLTPGVQILPPHSPGAG